ncbi:MAG: hypothetical protein Q8R82_21060 [Hyphomonadaceae bacterium]|nr:hypothetical protein [Hyphomonadaceae bacterium]
MNELSKLLFLAGGAATILGIAAYLYAYVARPKAFRPLHAVTLCANLMALAQLLALVQEERTSTSLICALLFVTVATAAQSLVAIRSRKARSSDRGTEPQLRSVG